MQEVEVDDGDLPIEPLTLLPDSGIYANYSPEFGEARTQDENRSAVDDCDSDDIAPGCNKPIQPESEDYTHEDEETVSSGYPSKGTSNSSNSTNDPLSDSESEGNSSTEEEEIIVP